MVKLGEQEKRVLRKEVVSLVVRKHAKYEEHQHGWSTETEEGHDIRRG